MIALLQIRKVRSTAYATVLIWFFCSQAFTQSASDLSIPSIESQFRKDLEEEYRLLTEEMKISTTQFEQVTQDISKLAANIATLKGDVDTLQEWVGGFSKLIDECEDDQARLFEYSAKGSGSRAINNYERILRRCRVRVERQMTRVASIREGIALAIAKETQFSGELSDLEPVLEILNQEQVSLRAEIQFLNDRIYGKSDRIGVPDETEPVQKPTND